MGISLWLRVRGSAGRPPDRFQSCPVPYLLGLPPDPPVPYIEPVAARLALAAGLISRVAPAPPRRSQSSTPFLLSFSLLRRTKINRPTSAASAPRPPTTAPAMVAVLSPVVPSSPFAGFNEAVPLGVAVLEGVPLLLWDGRPGVCVLVAELLGVPDCVWLLEGVPVWLPV